MNIDGNIEIIAHIGYLTDAFRAPLIDNPWFAKVSINAVRRLPDGRLQRHRMRHTAATVRVWR